MTKSIKPLEPVPTEPKSMITGISGFVGQYLARQLASQGGAVCGIDLESAHAPTEYLFSRCDILDFDTLSRVVREWKPVHVYHLAGLTHPQDSLSRPLDYYRTNVLGTVNLLEVLRQNEIEARILIVSTSKVYGKVPPDVELIDESQDPRPEAPYAVSKYLAEQVALQYFSNYGTQIVTVRPFNHTGPGQPTGFVVPDFCKQIAQIEALPPKEQASAELHVGDLSPVRDFLDVRDVVRAYSLLLRKGRPGETYNVSSSVGIQIGQLLKEILRLSELSPHKLAERWSALGSERGSSHIGDNRKLRFATGWSPESSLKGWLPPILSYWRSRMKTRP